MAKTVCPKCGSDRVWRSRRKGIEKLFLNTMIGLPYRCRSCRHRFYVFSNPLQSFTAKLTASAVVLVILITVFLSTEVFFTRHPVRVLSEHSEGEARTQKGAQVPREIAGSRDHAEVSNHSHSRDSGSDISHNMVSMTGPEWALFQARKSLERNRETERLLVIKTDELEVRENPSRNAKKIFILKRGQSVSMFNRSGDWYLVKLDDGRMGWVHKGQL